MSAQLTQPLGQNNCRQKAYKYLHFCFKKKREIHLSPTHNPTVITWLDQIKDLGDFFSYTSLVPFSPNPSSQPQSVPPSPEPLLGSEGHTDLLLVNNHLSRQSPSHSALLAQLSPFHLISPIHGQNLQLAFQYFTLKCEQTIKGHRTQLKGLSSSRHGRNFAT